MTLRQYARVTRVRSQMKEEAEKAEWTRTAVSVAYMMNMIGSAHSSKKNPWKTVQPKTLLDSWLGGKTRKEDFKARWDKAMKLHHERLKREKKKAL